MLRRILLLQFASEKPILSGRLFRNIILADGVRSIKGVIVSFGAFEKVTGTRTLQSDHIDARGS